jgi:hypothetical protein
VSIKMLREHLCADQARWQREWPSDIDSAVHVLIKMIDRHRPLGANGKHGDLHTPTCGCEDKPGTPW